MHKLALLVVSVILCVLQLVAAHDRPVIGIFSQPKYSMAEGYTYIAASYVKWIESAGGRVVPIPYDISPERAEVLMSQINGVLFPGGASEISESAVNIFKIALRKNEQGEYFPVWGTCMGFQWMSMVFSNDFEILDSYNSYNVTYPLIFTDEAKGSKFYDSLPQFMVDIYANPKYKVTLNNHHYGVNLESFITKLHKNFRLISINTDEDGKKFVSTMEHRKYPFYGVQWHPEKNNFEWDMYDNGVPYEAIEHTYEGILASQFPANFLVNEARKNDQKFRDPVFEKSKLIYNYNTTVSSYGFIQSYFFKNLDF